VKDLVNRSYAYGQAHLATVSFVNFGLGLVLAFFAVQAFVVNDQQSQQITRIERRSACEQDPNSYDCQHTKQEATRAASIYTTCIAFLKVGYECPRHHSKPAARARAGPESAQAAEPEPEPLLETGGGGAQNPSHPGQQPGGGGPRRHHAPPLPAPAPVVPAPEPEVAAPGNSGGHRQGNGPPHTPPGQAKKLDTE
jgi:hypothetical protein